MNGRGIPGFNFRIRHLVGPAIEKHQYPVSGKTYRTSTIFFVPGKSDTLLPRHKTGFREGSARALLVKSSSGDVVEHIQGGSSRESPTWGPNT